MGGAQAEGLVAIAYQASGSFLLFWAHSKPITEGERRLGTSWPQTVSVECSLYRR